MFKEVDKNTEDLVLASSFLSKIKGNDARTLAMLTANYDEDITDYDKAVTLCFYQCFLAEQCFSSADRSGLSDTNSVFQITFDVINRIDDTLSLRPEYWILWILKYKIISFSNYDEDEMIKSVEDLIREQDKETKQPYFWVTEILLAYIVYKSGQRDRACDILRNILVKYSQKVKRLNSFFSGYVAEFRNLIIRTSDVEVLGLIEEISVTFLGKQVI